MIDDPRLERNPEHHQITYEGVIEVHLYDLIGASEVRYRVAAATESEAEAKALNLFRQTHAHAQAQVLGAWQVAEIDESPSDWEGLDTGDYLLISKIDGALLAVSGNSDFSDIPEVAPPPGIPSIVVKVIDPDTRTT